MKRNLSLLLILVASLSACKKTETVEKIVEKTIEVPVNPFKKVAKNIIINGYGGEGVDFYTPLITRIKKFTQEEGAAYYGYYIYYGNYNFDVLTGQVDGSNKSMFVLCVNDWNVKVVYSLGWSGTEASNNRPVIMSTGQRLNLVPTNANFYKNELCGFVTKESIQAL